MRTNRKKSKNQLTDEEAIQKRIREMVFEESKRENQELEKKLNDQANAEALHEVTGVSKKKIEAITKKVRSEQEQEQKRIANSKSSFLSNKVNIFYIVSSIIFIIVVGVFIAGIFSDSNDEVSFGNPEEAEEVHKAIKDANMQLLRYLIIDKGYNVNQAHKRRLSYTDPFFTDYYLYHAIREKNTVMALFLINNGSLIAPTADIRNYLTGTVDYYKYTDLKQPMAEAMVKQAGEGSAVAKLLDKGYPYFKNDFNRAILDKDYEALKLFKEAQQGKFDYNWYDKGMAIAAFNNDPQMLNFFFDNWSKYSEQSLSGAFHAMIDWKNKEVAQKLLDEGAKIDARYKMPAYKHRKPKYYPGVSKEVTALETALMTSNTEMVKWLIGKGADINTNAILPLNIPFELGIVSGNFSEEHYNTIKLLIDNGASVNKRGYGQKRPLHNAKYIRKRGIKGEWLNKAIELLESKGAIE